MRCWIVPCLLGDDTGLRILGGRRANRGPKHAQERESEPACWNSWQRKESVLRLVCLLWRMGYSLDRFVAEAAAGSVEVAGVAAVVGGWSEGVDSFNNR